MATRTSHSRSRGGCLRCKSNRIKCDEQKPGCLRCQERKLPCPGYHRYLRWPAKHQQSIDHPSAEVTETPTTSRPLVNASQPVFVHEIMGPPPLTPVIPDLTLSYELPDNIEGPVSSPPRFSSSDLFPLPPSPSLSELGRWPLFSADWTEPILDGVPTSEIGSTDGVFTSETRSAGGENLELSYPGRNSPIIDPAGTFSNVPPPAPVHVSSALCQYFFKEVIPLYCVWDSEVNIMRIMAANLWQHSAPLFHTIQSMGAVCLAIHFPHLATVAIQERHRAIISLRNETRMNVQQDDRILSAWLLGHTASWHEPQNLALELFQETCVNFQDSVVRGDMVDTSMSFFEEALDYWAMLLAFFGNGKSQNPFRGAEVSIQRVDFPNIPALPHPWTGISRLTVQTMTDIGRLIFQYRSRVANSTGFWIEKDMEFFRDALRQGRILERRLLGYHTATEASIMDPGDQRTSKVHLQKLDEAYRHAGLLQLYRVFPDLLAERYAPWNENEILLYRPATKEPTRLERESWLTRLAVYILNILRQIPFESGTRCLQPFILVAVASELRYSPPRRLQATPFGSSGQFPPTAHATGPIAGNWAVPLLGDDFTPVDDFLVNSTVEVVQARQFVKSRLSAYSHVLPLQKTQKMLELVAAIWSALDAGQSDVYWLDVALKNQLHTVLG